MYQLKLWLKQQQVWSLLKQQGIFNLIVYVCIFLLPIETISIRHWASNFFILLFLLSIVDIIFRRDSYQTLTKQQRHYVVILFLFFSVFLVSALLNGWGKAQTYELGTVLRFLLAIPIFIMFRKLHFLLPVMVLASIVTVAADVIYLYVNPNSGVYGHLLSGPMILLSLLFFLPAIKHYRFHWLISVLLLGLLVSGVYTIFQLGTRSALVAIVLVSLFYIAYYSKGAHRIYYFIIFVVLGMSAYTYNGHLKFRVDKMVSDVTIYINTDNHATDNLNDIHSVSARLEMWRPTKYFVMRDSVWGFGPGNFEKEIEILIKNKIVNSVAMATHPHNAYVNELISKGILGLLLMLLVLYYPLTVFCSKDRINSINSIIGISVVLAVTAFSLTESASFNKNNFSSMVLFYLTAMLSVGLREGNNPTTLNEKNGNQ